jgi:phage gpG-like protein
MTKQAPLTQAELDHQITDDLMRKVGEDVENAIERTFAIAPQPWLPIAVQAAVTGLAAMVALLREDQVLAPMSERRLVMLAALIVGRCATDHGQLKNAITAAIADEIALLSTGRINPYRETPS